MTLTWLKRGNLKRETESRLIATQNNAIWTNYIEAKIDNIQENSKWMFCEDRDETVNREYSKLAQKEHKTRHNWLGKVSDWELCKSLEFSHSIKCYMYKPESVFENETHTLLWYLEIKTDNPISTGVVLVV